MHRGQLVTASMAAYAFAVIPFRAGAHCSGAPGDPDHPVPGRPRPQLHPLAIAANPFTDSGNWIGTSEPLWVGRVARRRLRDFLLRQFFLSIPRELADAARVDGANPWQIFRRIYLPLARPALATLAIFTFMWTWNDLLNPLIYLTTSTSTRRPSGLAFFQGQFIGKWPEMMAGAIVSLAPMIILFVIAQQYFVRGIALTGLKG